MSEKKKYYWLRLKRDFFKRHDITIIESMENGKDYILFYLKLLCESVDHEGNLRFSDEIPYDDKMLSVITDTNIDIVRSAIKIFTGLGMIELMDDGTYFMSGIEKLMGSETDKHVREQNRIRQQRYRDKKRLGMNNNICVYCGSDGDTIDHIIPKAVGGSDDASNIVHACLKCNMKKNDLPLDRFLNNKILDGENVDVDGILINPKLNKYVTFDYYKKRFEPLEALHNEMSRATCNGELEIEKELDKELEIEKKKKPVKHTYGEYGHVRLTDKERDTLMNEFGESETSEAIKYLDEYIEMKGYKAQSHYLCIRKWVFDAVRRDKDKTPSKNQSLAEKWGVTL